MAERCSCLGAADLSGRTVAASLVPDLLIGRQAVPLLRKSPHRPSGGMAAIDQLSYCSHFGASSYGINLKRQRSWPSLRVVAEARAFMAPECMAVVIIAARGAHFEHDE